MQALGRMPRQIPILIAILAGLLFHCNAGSQTATQPSPSTQPSGGISTRPALDRSIRVIVIRETAECVISIRGPYELVDANSGTVLAGVENPAHLLDFSPGAALSVTFRGGEVRLAELSRAFKADVLDLRPCVGSTVGLRMGEGLRWYRGWLRFVRLSATTAAVLNVVDVEDYLAGVVTAEMPAKFAPAALRAQAIAARTYAWYHKQFYGSTRDWDVQADESSQVYRGVDAETDAGIAAVRETAGLVCTWTSPDGDRIFPAYYSSTCGGASRSAPPRRGEMDCPVLAGDVRCDFCSRSPSYRWEPVSLSKKLISDRLHERYPRLNSLGPITGLEISERTKLGRPVQVEVYDDAGGREKMDVEEFRRAVDPTGRKLRSGYFAPVVEPDAIAFTDGRGFGHGKGLCQYGAQAQAQAGKTAIEILSFYYPGCHVVRAY